MTVTVRVERVGGRPRPLRMTFIVSRAPGIDGSNDIFMTPSSPGEVIINSEDCEPPAADKNVTDKHAGRKSRSTSRATD